MQVLDAFLTSLRPTALAALVLTAACTAPSRSTPPPMPAVRVASAPAAGEALEADLRAPGPFVDPTDPWPAAGVWASFQLAGAGPLGDFDDGILAGPNDTILVPDADAGEGWAAVLSYRWTRWEFLVQFEKTHHDGDFPTTTLDHDLDLTNIDVLLKRYYWVTTPVQPFALAGIGWSTADLENGTTSDGISFSEAELLDGVNFTLGAGLAFYPLPWVAVYGQGAYRFVEFYSVRGVEGRDQDRIDGNAWTVSVGASLRLLPGRHRRGGPR